MSWVRRLQAGLTHASRMLNSGALPPLDKAPERSLASALPAALFPALRPFATQPDKPGSEGAGTQQPKHESSDASGSKPSGRVNPVEEQVRMLLDAYSASGVVVERSMEDPRLGWQRAIEEGVGSWLQSRTENVTKTFIEKDFNLTEWLEGAKDAFWQVHNLLAEEDFDALRDMVSAKLLAAMQATAQDYHAAGIIWRTELDPSEPIQARISGTSLWTRSQIAEYDEDRAGVEDPPGAESYGPFGKWLVVSVQFKTTQRLVIEREGNGGVVARLTDRRPTTWKFASGPLPEKLPVAQLDTPWWLLNLG